MQCGIQVGYLLKRACSENATKLCGSCRRPVCEGHLSRTGDSGFMCVACAIQSADDTALDAKGAPIDKPHTGGTQTEQTQATAEPFIQPVSRFHSTQHYRADSWSDSGVGDDFADDDYRAFDAVSDFDKDLESSDLYDS